MKRPADGKWWRFRGGFGTFIGEPDGLICVRISPHGGEKRGENVLLREGDALPIHFISIFLLFAVFVISLSCSYYYCLESTVIY